MNIFNMMNSTCTECVKLARAMDTTFVVVLHELKLGIHLRSFLKLWRFFSYQCQKLNNCNVLVIQKLLSFHKQNSTTF